MCVIINEIYKVSHERRRSLPRGPSEPLLSVYRILSSPFPWNLSPFILSRLCILLPPFLWYSFRACPIDRLYVPLSHFNRERVDNHIKNKLNFLHFYLGINNFIQIICNTSWFEILHIFLRVFIRILKTRNRSVIWVYISTSILYLNIHLEFTLLFLPVIALE